MTSTGTDPANGSTLRRRSRLRFAWSSVSPSAPRSSRRASCALVLLEQSVGELAPQDALAVSKRMIAEDELEGQPNLPHEPLRIAGAGGGASGRSHAMGRAATHALDDRRHEVIVTAMTSHYLSLPTVNAGMVRAIGDSVMDAAGPVARPAVALFRAWRRVSGTRLQPVVASRLKKAAGTTRRTPPRPRRGPLGKSPGKSYAPSGPLPPYVRRFVVFAGF